MPSFADIDQRSTQSRRRDLLRAVAEGTAGVVGDEFLRCLVRHVAQVERGHALAEGDLVARATEERARLLVREVDERAVRRDVSYGAPTLALSY